MRDKMLSAMNASRQREGLSPVTSRLDLSHVALRWVEVMARTGKMKHNPKLAEEIQDWQEIAENVGWTSKPASVPRMHQSFMQSPRHRKNILNPRITEVGIAYREGNGGRVWWCIVFRRPS